MAQYTLYIFVGRTALSESETERAWTAGKISWPFGMHVFLLIAWMKVYFFILFYKRGSHHFEYLIIHLGICNFLVPHALSYYREESYEVIQDAGKMFQI